MNVEQIVTAISEACRIVPGEVSVHEHDDGALIVVHVGGTWSIGLVYAPGRHCCLQLVDLHAEPEMPAVDIGYHETPESAIAAIERLYTALDFYGPVPEADIWATCPNP